VIFGILQLGLEADSGPVKASTLRHNL